MAFVTAAAHPNTDGIEVGRARTAPGATGVARALQDWAGRGKEFTSSVRIGHRDPGEVHAGTVGEEAEVQGEHDELTANV